MATKVWNPRKLIRELFPTTKKISPRPPQYSLAAVSSCGILVWVKIAMVSTTKKLELFCSPPKSPSQTRDNQLQTQLCSLLGKAPEDLHKMRRFATCCATGFFFGKKRSRKRFHHREALQSHPGLILHRLIPWMEKSECNSLGKKTEWAKNGPWNHPIRKKVGRKKTMSVMPTNCRVKISGSWGHKGPPVYQNSSRLLRWLLEL